MEGLRQLISCEISWRMLSRFTRTPQGLPILVVDHSASRHDPAGRYWLNCSDPFARLYRGDDMRA